MTRTTQISLGAVITLWTLAVIGVAATGGFVTEGAVPWPTVIAPAVPVAAVVTLMVTGRLAAWVGRLDPRWPAAVQLWRVVGAAFLFGWQTGDLPAGFAVPAGVGDIATGVAALWFLMAVHRATLTRRHLVAFTGLGIGDFVVAVATGVALGPANLELMPWILFPVLAVPFFAAVHAVSWVQLRGVAIAHEDAREDTSRVVGSSSISSPTVTGIERTSPQPVATAQT